MIDSKIKIFLAKKQIKFWLKNKKKRFLAQKNGRKLKNGKYFG